MSANQFLERWIRFARAILAALSQQNPELSEDKSYQDYDNKIAIIENTLNYYIYCVSPLTLEKRGWRGVAPTQGLFLGKGKAQHPCTHPQKTQEVMKISVEQFLDLVTIRAKVAFMLALAEKTIWMLQDDLHVYSLARNLLDYSWQWEEFYSVSPFEIFEYLESSSEDCCEQEKLSLVCQFNTQTPEPTLTAIMTIINAGSIAAMYAYQAAGVRGGLISDIITNLEEKDVIPGTVDSIIKHQLLKEEWINRTMSYLISNHKLETLIMDELWLERTMYYLMSSYEPEGSSLLGKPIMREELLNLL